MAIMAARQAPILTRLMRSRYMCMLILVITVATVSTPAQAGDSPPPSKLVLYGFQYSTSSVEVASPSGNLSASEFGSTNVIADPLRETPTLDGPVVGFIAGQIVTEQYLSFYASNTYVLNTTSYTGSISVQGILDVNGEGEVSITGGTYDFRWARGYADLTVVSEFTDPFVVKIVFQIKYD